MIEINLVAQGKKFKMPTVLGVDLAVVNLKLLAMVSVLVFLGRSYFEDYTREERREMSRMMEELSAELRNLRSELQGSDSLREELENYNQQVERLKERSEQVRIIINQRSNPRLILETIARNLPEDMWIDRLNLEPNRNVSLRGGSESYSSIGNFIIEVNNTPFFTGLNLQSSNTEEILEGGQTRRVEVFEIRGKVSSYDSRVQ